jgi:hypothetical protein
MPERSRKATKRLNTSASPADTEANADRTNAVDDEKPEYAQQPLSA